MQVPSETGGLCLPPASQPSVSGMSYKGRCELCNAERETVGVAVVRWISDGRAFEYESLPRCLGHAACRGRVEARGEKWEVDDSNASPSDGEP